MTPEERRQAHLDAIAEAENGHRWGDVDPECAYDRLLEHFDNHTDPNERALGQMLRNGAREVEVAHYPEGCYERFADKEWAEVPENVREKGYFAIAQPPSLTEDCL